GAAATPVVGTGLMRPASEALTPPVTRRKVAVSWPPPPMLTALLLLVLVFVPPPVIVNLVLAERLNVVDPLARVTITAWPEPDRARPATARTVIAVRPELAPKRNLVSTC